jgi:hypothetical protein
MNYLKYIFLTIFLVAVFCLTASAQDKEGEKKIPKPNPPIVIVNPDKKGGEKPKENGNDKRGNKPEIILFD